MSRQVISTQKYGNTTEIWKGDRMLGEYAPLETNKYEWVGGSQRGTVNSAVQAASNILSVDLDGEPIYTDG